MNAERHADRVRTEQVDRVMVVHLDDGKANALSPAMLAAIGAALDAAEADESIGAVVLHGRPGRIGISNGLCEPVGSPTDALVADSRRPGRLGTGVCTVVLSRFGRPIRFAWGSLGLNTRVALGSIGIELTCGAAPSWFPLSAQPKARCL